jgi:hypothetical protein
MVSKRESLQLRQNCLGGDSTYDGASSGLLIDILEVSHEVRHRVLRHRSHIHSSDVVFDGVELSEIEAAHGFELLVVRGRVDSDGLFDETTLPFFGKGVGIGARRHVYDGVLFDFSGGQAVLGQTLAAVSVDGAGSVQC